MPHAYVTDAQARVRIEHERLRVEKEGELLADWKIAQVESLTLIGTVQITAQALHGLLEAGIETNLLSGHGRFLGRVTSPRSGDIRHRLAQYRAYLDPDRRLRLAKRLVVEKLDAMIDLLRRYADNYSDAAANAARRWLGEQAPRVRATRALDELRGVEGACAARYWSAFARLNRSPFPFAGRSARPPRDPVNSLLGASYSLLVTEVVTACLTHSLDPYLGFYHEPRNERPALALDLMEPLRHLVVDRLVLRLANRKILDATDFYENETGAIWLRREAWKRLLQEWNELMVAGDQRGHGPQPGWRDRIRDRVAEHARVCLSPGIDANDADLETTHGDVDRCP